MGMLGVLLAILEEPEMRRVILNAAILAALLLVGAALVCLGLALSIGPRASLILGIALILLVLVRMERWTHGR